MGDQSNEKKLILHTYMMYIKDCAKLLAGREEWKDRPTCANDQICTIDNS